uniref:Uncharacterized protein n=1 Tax=Ditylenchus dipsaci TaxID=166011 RepID=A0A915EC18_9BILA
MHKAVDAASKIVKPVSSSNPQQARRNVLAVYKDLQQQTPQLWFQLGMQDIPLPLFRELLKNEFLKNKHIQDVRVIDRKVEETKHHIISTKLGFYNTYVVRNYLFGQGLNRDLAAWFSRCVNSSYARLLDRKFLNGRVLNNSDQCSIIKIVLL